MKKRGLWIIGSLAGALLVLMLIVYGANPNLGPRERLSSSENNEEASCGCPEIVSPVSGSGITSLEGLTKCSNYGEDQCGTKKCSKTFFLNDNEGTSITVQKDCVWG